MSDPGQIFEKPQRLCSEIQLFDLCELEICRHKNGRFCSEPALLERFERIAEKEQKVPERYISEEIDDADGVDEYDNEYAEDAFEDHEDDDWDDDE
ncbi:MAG: hypothetical protein PHY09_05230 [Desulfuromonadaceae bacterium]|nr:hypothetical protein [Desulfuromonadaceae bacterium]MDD5106191.1 hypothetical protein [Desulfuromonadaceae bacterium]